LAFFQAFLHLWSDIHETSSTGDIEPQFLSVTLHTYPILFLYQANLVDVEFIGVLLFLLPLERLAVHFFYF
jgi:hypothetical protein